MCMQVNIQYEYMRLSKTNSNTHLYCVPARLPFMNMRLSKTNSNTHLYCVPACLPFMNMLSKQASISAKKRKRSSDGSLVVQKSPRVQRVEKCDDDPGGRKIMASKVCNTDNEVSSSSWNGKCDKTPKSKTTAGPLDNYMRSTQQREVSTSVVDDEGVIDLTDANVDTSRKNACNNNDVCEDVTMVEVNSRDEDKENVAVNDVSTCENDCKTNTDCEIHDADSDNEADSENEAEADSEAEADNEAESENEAESDNEAEEASASSEKKDDGQSTAGDVDCGRKSSTEVASPEKRLDSPGIDDLDESFVSNDNEVTPKKFDSAKNCATPTSSSVPQSTPSPCPSSSATGFTTPVSSTKFKVCMFPWIVPGKLLFGNTFTVSFWLKHVPK